MKSTPKIRQIYDVFDNLQEYFATSSPSLDLVKLNKTLLNYYSPGPSFQYIYNFASRQFDWVSDNVRDILAVEPSEFTVEDYVEKIHNDDMDHFAHCEAVSGHFLFKHVSKLEIPNYKICYQLRMKDASGKYKLFLRQSVAIALDEHRNLAKALCNTSNISHITNRNNNTISYIDLSGRKSYYGISKIKDLQNKIKVAPKCSAREMDILRLIAEGYRSKEIASFLHISQETVRTHRANILKKTMMRSLTQVACEYVKQGLL